VVQTGCAAIETAQKGLMVGEACKEAGPVLEEVCKHVGIPPVLHLGSCVDNSRILTILTEIVEEGGLGEDISEIPAVGICPGWFTEKSLAIGTYFVASGINVIYGGIKSPTTASSEVTSIFGEGWLKKTGAGLYFIEEPEEIVAKALQILDEKRRYLDIVGFGLDNEAKLPDRERKKVLRWWQKRLKFLLRMSLKAPTK
jgi:carbon-monoxide dehydrogenase catalytic subunit